VSRSSRKHATIKARGFFRPTDKAIVSFENRRCEKTNCDKCRCRQFAEGKGLRRLVARASKLPQLQRSESFGFAAAVSRGFWGSRDSI
jgi:hypothetical protein